MGPNRSRDRAPSFFTAPVEFIVATVSAAEPTLEREVIERLVLDISDTRSKQRELAKGLHDLPDLLTAGKPEGPIYAQLLITRLNEFGARNVQSPACARCSRRGSLLPRHGPDGRRICESCADYIDKQAMRGSCDRCGVDRPLVLVDIDGAEICAVCAVPERSKSHAADIVRFLEDQRTGLPTDALNLAVQQALPNLNQQRSVYRELRANPTLLRANPARGTHRVVVLAEVLISSGAAGIATPACTICGSESRIKWKAPSGRSCRSCYESDRRVECSRCGETAIISSRTSAGKPLCTPCGRQVTYNHEQCTNCDSVKLIVHRDENNALCKACWRGYEAECSVCGRVRPCHFADSEAPRCEHCSRRRDHCSICGAEKIVNTRTPEGEPICPDCARRSEDCSRCGKNNPVATRTEDGKPLCPACWRKDPRSFDDCKRCGRHERLRRGLCVRCTANDMLEEFLRDGNGNLYPNAHAVRDAFASADPVCLSEWLRRSSGAAVLLSLIQQDQPITHARLDEFWPNQTVHAFRAVLVAGGALPSRDEQLANFEQWYRNQCGEVNDAVDRSLITNYANWQIVRRLRDKATRRQLSYYEVAYARRQVYHVARFLAWLRDGGITKIENLSQREVDSYLADRPEARLPLRSFTQWLRKSRQGRALEVPLPGQHRPFEGIAADERWKLVKRLLHDETLSNADRFAGLLVLLYAQRLGTVVTLKVSSVYERDSKTLIELGETALELPEPVAEIAWMLAKGRRHHIQLARPESIDWLFPGGLPGHHLTAERMGERLRAIGIQVRKSRNAALRDLVPRLPSAVIASLLGLSPRTAATLASSLCKSNADYGAIIARRV